MHGGTHACGATCSQRLPAGRPTAACARRSAAGCRRVTLAIFPGVLAEDVHSAELGSWYPVALLTVFNLADWAGKTAPWLPVWRLR